MRPVDWKQRPAGNVIPLRPRRPDHGIHRARLEGQIQPSSPFDTLTTRIIMQRHAAGTLDPAIVAALLLAVDLTP
jgi:hypothetical protein